MVRFKTSAGNEIWHVENDMNIVGVNTKARISVSTGHNDKGVKDVLIRYSYPKSRILRGMDTLNIQFSTRDGDVYIPDRNGFSDLCRHGYLNDLVAFFRDIMIVISDDIGPEYMIPNDLIARSFVIIDGEEGSGDRARIVTEYDLTGRRRSQWSGKDHIGYNMHDPMGRIRFYREFIPGVYNDHAMTPSYGMDMVCRLFANNISVPESFMILSLRDVLKTPDDFCSMLETKSVCGFIVNYVAIRCDACVGVYSLIMDMAGIYRSTILNTPYGDDEECYIMDGMVMQTIMEVVWKQYRDHITPSNALYRDIGAFVRDFINPGEVVSSEKVVDIGPVHQDDGPSEINGVSIILKGNSVVMDIRMMNEILLTKDNLAFRDMVFHGLIDPDSHRGFRNVLMVNEKRADTAFEHNMVVIGYSDYDNRIYVLNDMLDSVPSGIEAKFMDRLKREKPQRVSSSDDPDSCDFDFDADVTDIPLPPVSRMSFDEFGEHVANGLLKTETSESDREVLSRLMAYVMDAMVPESVEIDDAKEVERLVAIMSGGDIHDVAISTKVKPITSSAGSFFSVVESLSDYNGIGIEFSRIALNEADRKAVGVLLVDSSGHAFYLYASESSRGIAVCSSSLEHAGIVRSWIISKLNDETGKLFFTGAAKRGRILSADEINGDVDDVRKSTTPACYDLLRGFVTLSDENAEFMNSSGKSTSVTGVSKTGSDYDRLRLAVQKGYVHILNGNIPNSGEEGISNWKFLEKGLPAIRVSSGMDGAAFFDALIAEFPYFRSQSAFVAQRYALCRKTGKPFFFPPMLLNGAPGIGKTRWSRKIADMTGTGSHLISMAGTNSSLSIIGSERGYREARPGMWAFAMQDSQTANPIMILDEIDKTNNGNNGSAIESLLPFLEKETSRRYHDRFLMTEADVSMISYIMTSNTIRTLPEAFLSRIRLFECRVPTMEEINVIFGNIVHDIVSELGMDDADIKGLDFDDIRRSYVDNSSIRVLRQGIEKRIMRSVLDIDIDDKNGLNGRNAVGFRM